MIRNYFTIAYRNLLKNKIYSLVNIFGLALGMAACFFIYQYVHFESDYDRFNTNASRLYRLAISYTADNDNAERFATISPAVAPAMNKELPEVVGFTRVVNSSLLWNTTILSYSPANSSANSFYEKRIFLADAGFFKLFSYTLIDGNAQTCLTAPHSIVLTKSLGKKYFGEKNPIGETMFINGTEHPYTVTALIENVPENSHLQFDALISTSSIGENWGYDDWDYPEFYSYVLLAPGTEPAQLKRQLPAFINQHMKGIMKTYNFNCQFHLQPVTDIHSDTTYQKDVEAHAGKKELALLSLIGLFMLVMAWINYINLSTAKSLERAKEVGLRKVVGAAKHQLFSQFLFESALLNLIAILVALIIILSCIPLFRQFIGKDVSAGFFSTGLGSKPSFWWSVVAVWVTGSIVVGAYPAAVLSSFRPATVLKGISTRSTSGITLRRGLVVFQFLLSVSLLAATFVIYRQLRFMQQADMGYHQDQMLIVKAPQIGDEASLARFNYFKRALLQNTAVIGVAASSDIPGALIRYQNVARRIYQDKTTTYSCDQLEIDENFIHTYQIPVVAGRNFTPRDSSRLGKNDHPNVLINEAMASAMGFASARAAVDQQIICMIGVEDIVCRVVGVIHNFHQLSLKEKYAPIICYYPSHTDWKYCSIHLNMAKTDTHLAAIEQLYKNTFAQSPFDYFFLDDYFNLQYMADQRLGKVFGLFGVLAVVIACLGLLGLSSFMIRLRTKEIGVRKVLGASVTSILVLFSREYVRLIALASVIALPIVYTVAHQWLINFPFHMLLSWWLFALPPVALLVISLAMISLQTIRAALTNPIRSLKE